MALYSNSPSTNIGCCKLCNSYTRLELSHIYPKFIINWLKKTGTGFLRGGNNLNIKVQDGLKCYLLCVACEDRLSRLETSFSKSIFYPVVNDNICEFSYNEDLFKFTISVLWRLLHHSILEDEKGYLSYELLLKAELEWREYLLNNKQPSGFDKLHLLIGVDVSLNKIIEEQDLLPLYMGRYIDAGVTDDNESLCLAFLKLPRFFFLIPLAGFSADQMINTEIMLSRGLYKINETAIANPTVVRLLLDRVNQYKSAREQISPNQKQKMKDIGVQKWDDIKNKDLGRILMYLQDTKE